MNGTKTTALLAALAALALAGCGEEPQVVLYEQGEYKGKPDARPWENPRFDHDRTAWERAIKARQMGQNEYLKAP